MGLDVSVYTGLEEVDISLCYVGGDEDELTCNHISPYVVLDEWEYKIKNVLGKHLSYKNRYRIMSYSYSTHGRFRVYLLYMSGRDDLLDDKSEIKWDLLDNTVPFYELINFSDCEGFLDYEISEKIYIDFVKYDSKNRLMENKLMKRYYDEWMEVFMIASLSKGVVEFH